MENVEQIPCAKFADALREIFEHPGESIEVDYAKHKDIPMFDLPELFYALKKMANRRGADKSEIVVGMMKFGITKSY